MYYMLKNQYMKSNALEIIKKIKEIYTKALWLSINSFEIGYDIKIAAKNTVTIYFDQLNEGFDRAKSDLSEARQFHHVPTIEDVIIYWTSRIILPEVIDDIITVAISLMDDEIPLHNFKLNAMEYYVELYKAFQEIENLTKVPISEWPGVKFKTALPISDDKLSESDPFFQMSKIYNEYDFKSIFSELDECINICKEDAKIILSNDDSDDDVNKDISLKS